jgi:hypothetical protein
MKTISILLIFSLAAGLHLHPTAGAVAPEKKQKTKRAKTEKPVKIKRKALPGIGPFSNLLLLEKSLRRREMEEKAKTRNSITVAGRNKPAISV